MFLFKFLVSCTLVSVAFALLESEEESEEDFESHIHPHGSPLNVMQLAIKDPIKIDYDAIDKIFLNPTVAGRKIVAISIIGAFRKGKSFLMDYCLRFMYANVSKNTNKPNVIFSYFSIFFLQYKSVNFTSNPLDHKENWIGLPNEPLRGFSWKSGPHRHTSGIVIWSDVFLYDAPINNTSKVEKIAIILMDTQGLFDPKTSPSDNSKIFALGTLISSVQIFNLNDVVQENQLEYLHMATDYAKFVTNNTQDTNIRPFQNLLFLMRDWAYDDDFSFGLQGGERYLDDVLKIRKDQSPQLGDVREYIRKSFDKVFCFLLPHPGLQILSENNYDGRYSKLTPKFQKHLKSLLEWLLAPNNLNKKRILNLEVTGRQFNNFVKEYLRTFQSPNLPQVLSVYEATLEIQFSNFVEMAVKEFKDLLKAHEPNYYSKNFNNDLTKFKNDSKKTALLSYNAHNKMGSEVHESKYKAILVKEMDTYGNQWVENLSDTYNKMIELEAENEKKKQKIQREAAEKHLIATKALEAQKLELKNQMELREKKIAQDLILKEEEKRKAIKKLQDENVVQQKEADSKMQTLLKEQQAERERITKEAMERARKTEEEIQRLKQEQINKNRMFELQLQTDRETRLAEVKKEADERREERRLLQEQIDKKDATWRDELKLVRDQITAESTTCQEQLQQCFANRGGRHHGHHGNHAHRHGEHWRRRNQ